MKHIKQAMWTLAALFESAQNNQAGARYLVALAAIGSVVYVLHWLGSTGK